MFMVWWTDKDIWSLDTHNPAQELISFKLIIAKMAVAKTLLESMWVIHV